MSFWSVTNTSIEDDVVYVNNTYKDSKNPNKNALSTINASNPGGYVSVDQNSSDPLVKKLAYAVQTDGKITYLESGTNNQYNSIQQIQAAKSLFQVPGSQWRPSTTPVLLKSAMQKNLQGLLTSYNGANPTSKIGPPQVTPPVQPPPGGRGPGGGSQSINLNTNIAGKTTQERGSYGTWVYPTGLTENAQDYIRFQMIEYGGLKTGPKFDNKGSFGLQRNINITAVLGTVCLPIQPSITDISSVDWQNDTINPLQLLGAEVSLGAMNGSFSEAQFSDILGRVTDPATKSYLQQWAAGKAVGTNIFSRFGGAVVNPNLELLFNGPQLRPFNFNFRLSPRSDGEAKQVKNIIQFFKKGMAVRRTEQDLFLKGPNVFQITYINGRTNETHESINKIKICSLTQCSIDYTPDGSYATFDDNAATMTQYGMTLQFNEIEPVFNEEYDLPNAESPKLGY